MILAEINFADILWSMIAFFFFVIFLWMIFGVITDIFRSDDLSGGMKALWAIAIVFVPWLTIFVYLIARGSGMAERALRSEQVRQEQLAAYAQTAAPPPASAATEIKNAKELLDSGTISPEEFEGIKSRALADA